MRVFASNLLLPLGLLICGLAVAQTLPARFEHNRIFLEAAAPDGEKVTFYTDTGGGFNAITESIADRYSLMPHGTARSENGERLLVAFPAFAEAAGIPRPLPDSWLNGNLAVVPDSQLEVEGLLGSRWFAGRIWKFDFGRRRLSRINSFEGTNFESTPLGFRHGPSGRRNLNFPRVDVVIDGERLSMLLDTGATAKLTEFSAPVYGLKTGTLVGTSYVVRSIFDSWRDRHPGWRVVENADAVTDQYFPMIEVPSVEVAGITVGPVWFSLRPDDTFRKWTSQMTDRPVEGAVGGSMFKHLRMVIDYPAAMAYFQELSAQSKSVE